MRWIKSLFHNDHRISQRGSSSVFVALTMVLLLGFVAIALDVGRIYWEKAQLQNAADAGALATASICSLDSGAPECLDRSKIVEHLVDFNDEDTHVDSIKLQPNDLHPTSVTVDVSAQNGEKNSVTTWFARVLNTEESDFSDIRVSASATASWGPASSATTKFPLAFSKCEVDAGSTPNPSDVDGPPALITELQFIRVFGPDTGPSCALQPANNMEVPGGFGWLPSTLCTSKTAVGAEIEAEMGTPKKVPVGCEATVSAWKKALTSSPPGEVVVFLPVFDNKSGKNLSIYAYAAFEIHGWIFDSVGSSPKGIEEFLPTDAQAVFDKYVLDAKAYNGPGSGSAKSTGKGLIGKFQGYVFDDVDGELGGGVDYGAPIIRLTK